MTSYKPPKKGDGGCFGLLSSCFRTQQKEESIPLKAQKPAAEALASSADQSQLVTYSPGLPPISHAVVPTDKERTKDLWQEAFDQLDDESDKKSIDANVNKPGEKFDIDGLVDLIQGHEETFKEKSVKITIGDQDIFWRDCAKRTVSCIKTCGDIAMPFAPEPSSIVWSAVKVLLNAHVDQCENLIAILGCAEKALRLVRVGAICDRAFLQIGLTEGSQSFELMRAALVRMYKTILLFLIHAKEQLNETSAISQFCKALWNPGEADGLIKDLHTAEQELNTCMQACNQELSVANNREVQKRLQSLDERICYIDRGVSKILSDMEDQQMRNALNYISDVHVGNQHIERRKNRTEGTGKWLLNDEVFREWENTSSSALLWLRGDAGAGKSTLASHIVDRYWNNGSKASVPTDEGFAFFYFRKTDQDGGDQVLNVLRSFVRQLATIPNYPEKMVAFLIQRCKDMEKSQQPFDKSLCEESLLQLINLLPRTVIVLDGLDEFDKEDMKIIMQIMVKLLGESQRPLKMFISSRDRPDIRSSLSNARQMLATITVADKNEPDIEKFVKKRVKEIGEDWGQEVRDKVERRLCTESGGMFRWAFLQVEQLKGLGSDDAIMNRIGRLPKGLEQAYDELYEKDELIDRMYLERAVRWTMYALQPLSTEELLAAVRFGTSDDNGVIELKTMGSVSERQFETLCRYLIVKDIEGNWKFPHASVQEYFLEKHGGWAGQNGKAEITKLSLLLVRKANLEPPDWAVKIVEAEMAAREVFWAEEANHEPSARGHVEKQLEMEAQGSTINSGSENTATDPVSSLWLYVSKYWFSHVKLIQCDIKNYPEISQLLHYFMVDGEREYENWAKYYPAAASIFVVAEYLVGGLRPTSMAVLGLIVLGIYPAAMQWGEDCLESNPECTNAEDYSILSLAVKHGPDVLCRQLIGLGSDINRIVRKGSTSALEVALKQGKKSCAITLLEHGADPNLETCSHSLCCAIVNCYDKVLLDLLLNKGADPEAICRICNWECPLIAAAKMDNTEAAVTLIDAGARLDFPGGRHGTPLLQAAKSGSLQVAKLLVGRGADVDVQTEERYGGVLAAAFCNGKSEMLAYLIEEAEADPYRLIFDLVTKKPVVYDFYDDNCYEEQRKKMAAYLLINQYLEVNDSRVQEMVNMPGLEMAKPLMEMIEVERCNRVGN
ncbi:hypothetical protein FPOAC2_09932 [Fusarium poae]